jgi:hypothetical protein
MGLLTFGEVVLQRSEWPARDEDLACDPLPQESEQTMDVAILQDYISGGLPPDLSFPHTVHCLVTIHGTPRCRKGAKALFRIDSSFDCAVIRFNDVVEVLHGQSRRRRLSSSANSL